MVRWIAGFLITYLILTTIVYAANIKYKGLNEDVAWKEAFEFTGGFVALIVVVWFLFQIRSCEKAFDSTANKPKTTETTIKQPLDWTHYYNDTEHKATYRTIMKYAVNEYINGVKWPSWDFSDYNFIDYDKTNSGTILGSIKVGIDGLIEKQDVYVIFTIIDGIKDYKVNSVVVGNKTYYDDGKMANLLKSFN